MKTTIVIMNAVFALAIPGVNCLRAQDKPEPEVLPAIGQSLRESEDEVRVQLGKAKQQLGEVRDRMATIVRRDGDGPSQTLVVRHSGTDPKTQANLEEDLAVMARILEKAAAQNPDEGRLHHAMGIDVVFGPGPNSPRSIYLEGYGALFMLKVGFPLLPPPSKPDARKEEPQGSSTWEDVRRELYGQRSGKRIVAPPTQPYSEEQVKTLKDGLLDALKNASNIRELKADDAITLCVFGGATGNRFKALVKR